MSIEQIYHKSLFESKINFLIVSKIETFFFLCLNLSIELKAKTLCYAAKLFHYLYTILFYPFRKI